MKPNVFGDKGRKQYKLVGILIGWCYYDLAINQ